jgi:hypothetical protein
MGAAPTPTPDAARRVVAAGEIAATSGVVAATVNAMDAGSPPEPSFTRLRYPALRGALQSAVRNRRCTVRLKSAPADGGNASRHSFSAEPKVAFVRRSPSQLITRSVRRIHPVKLHHPARRVAIIELADAVSARLFAQIRFLIRERRVVPRDHGSQR